MQQRAAKPISDNTHQCSAVNLGQVEFNLIEGWPHGRLWAPAHHHNLVIDLCWTEFGPGKTVPLH